MAIRDIFKVSRKTFLNPSAWLDFESIKAQNALLWTILRGLFTTPKPEITETFTEAMQRYGINEADLKDTERTYTYYAILFLVIGIGLIFFAFYLLLHHGTFHGWMLSLAASALSLTQAFRYDFWAFQIKHRKLGCTFAEWKRRKPLN